MPIPIIMMDIDYFKRYNDAYGHQAGDQCLQAVAACLPGAETGVFAARYGGEEFAVILPGAGVKEARELAESIRQRVEELRMSHVESDIGPWLTVSLGAASGYPGEIADSGQILRQADQALYRAKAQGRNQVG